MKHKIEDDLDGDLPFEMAVALIRRIERYLASVAEFQRRYPE